MQELVQLILCSTHGLRPYLLWDIDGRLYFKYNKTLYSIDNQDTAINNDRVLHIAAQHFSYQSKFPKWFTLWAQRPRKSELLVP